MNRRGFFRLFFDAVVGVVAALAVPKLPRADEVEVHWHGFYRALDLRAADSPTIRLGDLIVRDEGHRLFFEMVTWVSPPLPACPYCGSDEPLVRVHGHLQCRRCTAVVERCCE